jgi:hypothetical protein
VSAAKTSAAAEMMTAALLTGTSSLSNTDEPSIIDEGIPVSAVNFPEVGEAWSTAAQMGNRDVMRDGRGIVIGVDNNVGA